MPRLLRLPEIAADTTEATLTAWSLTPSTSFTTDTPLAVVETAKAAVDITADADGVLLATLVDPDTEVTVGQPLALLGDLGEAVEDIDAALVALGLGPRGEAAPEAAPLTAPAPAPPPPSVRARRVFASPLARRLAREAGIDIARIPGTGPHSRVLKRDVESARLSAPVPAVSPVPARPEPAARVVAEPAVELPHTRMRRTIAARLVASKQDAPHFYLRGTVCVDDLLALRRQINDAGPGRVSINDLVVKAAALAHVAVPEMNVVWTSDSIRRFSSVDIAVAVATDGGLVTPVIRDVASLGVAELARRTAEVGERARAGRLSPAELEGGSISVTNLGMYGVEEFTAIINPPQAAILAVGAVTSEPTVVDGQVVVAQRMRLTLSVDHRPVDGVVAARWMQAVLDALAHPIRLLL